MTLLPESVRVIIRPFIPSDVRRVTTIIGRALALSEDEVVSQLALMRQDFDERHYDIEALLEKHFEKVRQHKILAAEDNPGSREATSAR